ncbi:MAG: glycosyltransferase family 2 protein [Bacteroidales bacterium]|nr:glycosyltransferase family 2 protein [Bacteroidales bacterium]
MHKAAFVILHHETISDTIECIDSIVSKIVYPNWQIVVVDNGSSSHPREMLQKRYSNDPRIHILINKKNLGFARGNNTGYHYAREILKADFIIIINNDTILQQRDFVSKILARYKESKYDILGPDIISIKNGSHQNPRKEVLINANVVKSYIRYFKISLWLNYFCIDNLVIRIKKFFFPASRLPVANKEHINPDNSEMEQVKLHGSAMVFSPDYLKRYDYAFFPETFLYCEESILYYIARRDGLITVYYPGVQIYHKEDATSDFLTRKGLLRRRFILRHNIHSHKVFLRILKEE